MLVTMLHELEMIPQSSRPDRRTIAFSVASLRNCRSVRQRKATPQLRGDARPSSSIARALLSVCVLLFHCAYLHPCALDALTSAERQQRAAREVRVTYIDGDTGERVLYSGHATNHDDRRVFSKCTYGSR